jgi:sialidase-1
VRPHANPSGILLCLPLLCLWMCPSAGGAEGVARTDVFTSGTEGYHTFRIPSLIVTRQGTLLAFCEGRKNSRADHGDVHLVLKRSTDGGHSWGLLQLVHKEGPADITIGNPCPVVDQHTGTVWLTFTRDNKDVFVTPRSDDGKTWAGPVNITAGVKKPGWIWYATGPGTGIQVRRGPYKGRLVIPCDHKMKGAGRPVFHSHVIYSDDHGTTWTLGGIAAPHTNECQVAEVADGSLLLNMRNYWGSEGKEPAKGKMRAVTRSKDGGQTWGELRFDKTLIEPVCQASLHGYPWADREHKTRLLFANPASTTWRHQLTVRLSYDEGATWPIGKVLEDGPSAYSCLADLPDGHLACLHERGRKDAYEKITLARFTLAWLTDGQDDPGAQTLVVGHRGLARHAPENTLSNIRACLDLRVSIELDVRRSKDGRLVVLHDRTLDRTTNGRGKVGDFPLAELRKLDAGSWFDAAFKNERLPTLEEVFALRAKYALMAGLIAVDIKEPDTEEDLVRLAQKHDVLDRLVFIGLAISDAGVRRRLRAVAPKAHVACLATSPAQVDAALKEPDADWVYVRHVPGRDEVARVRAAGKRLFLSGPRVAGRELDNWKQAIDHGVDAILTDHPLELAGMVRSTKE